MSRIELKCCLSSTPYLAGFFYIFILLHIWQNRVWGSGGGWGGGGGGGAWSRIPAPFSRESRIPQSFFPNTVFLSQRNTLKSLITAKDNKRKV